MTGSSRDRWNNEHFSGSGDNPAPHLSVYIYSGRHPIVGLRLILSPHTAGIFISRIQDAKEK
jgi:hypothetical protein